jgi:predicted TIM-barrel fold metal-dependent hydrolase
VAPAARALAASHPDRLVWGTNWPHPVRFRAMPEDGDLLDALAEWLGDEDSFRRALVENPARLYGFAQP